MSSSEKQFQRLARFLKGSRVKTSLLLALAITFGIMLAKLPALGLMKALTYPAWIIFAVSYSFVYVLWKSRHRRYKRLAVNLSKPYVKPPRATQLQVSLTVLTFALLLSPTLLKKQVYQLMDHYRGGIYVEKLHIRQGGEVVKLKLPAAYALNLRERFDFTTIDPAREPIVLTASFPSFEPVKMAALLDGVQLSGLVKVTFYPTATLSYEEYLDEVFKRISFKAVNYELLKGLGEEGEVFFTMKGKLIKRGTGYTRTRNLLETAKLIRPNTYGRDKINIICFRESCEIIRKIEPLSVVTIKFDRSHVESWFGISSGVESFFKRFIQ